MMSGVPLGDGLRRERLIEWYYEEKQSEIAQTMLLVAAITKQDDINDYVTRYINTVIPSDKANESYLEEHQETLAKEAGKKYQVKRILLPGEME